jgi:hypothetical protein
MGHCSRNPGAERRRFFELKRYVRADRALTRDGPNYSEKFSKCLMGECPSEARFRPHSRRQLSAKIVASKIGLALRRKLHKADAEWL